MSLSLDIRKFIEKEELFLESNALLCAVSGGRDSMVMLDILRTLGYQVEVAHINYMLRDDDSMKDEALITHYCQDHNINLHIKRLSFDEVRHLEEGNLQEKARDLRYTWFDHLMTHSNCDLVCVAHHKGDVAETFLLHALRGAGSNGLKSIQYRSGYIRRPLLNSSPRDIEEYASDIKVPYRHDQSNFSNKYDRNYIRNNTISSLIERWPSTIDKLADAAANISNDLNLLNFLVNQEKSKWITHNKIATKLGPLSQLRNHKQSQALTYQMLKDFNFNYDVVDQMLTPSSAQGAVFYSDDHIGCIHNDHLLIRKKTERSDHVITISFPQEVNLSMGRIVISKTDALPAIKSPNEEFIMIDSSRWPLKLRPWQEGDKIKPLGMHGQSKKISDILIDQKASYFEKEDQLVLTDNSDEVIYVIGRKLSETVRYNSETKEYLKLEFTAST